MMEERLNRELDKRCAYLLLLRRLFLVPLAGILMALVCGLLYREAYTRLTGARQYRQTAQYYLDFAYNEQTQENYDHFNAATWDVLLFTHPGIFEVVEKNLPEGVSLERASEEAFADLYSDIRVLSVEVTSPTPEETEGIGQAVRLGLESFGETAKEFTKITFLSADEPHLVIVRDRTVNALLLGAVLGMLAAAILLWIWCVTDDGIYIPEEAEKRFSLPVLAVYPGKNPLPPFLEAERETNLERALGDKEKLVLVGGFGKNRAEKKADACVVLPVKEVKNIRVDDDPALAEAAAFPGEAVFAVPFGCGGGRRLRHALSEAQKAGIRVLGLVITDADGSFLRKYYG